MIVIQQYKQSTNVQITVGKKATEILTCCRKDQMTSYPAVR